MDESGRYAKGSYGFFEVTHAFVETYTWNKDDDRVFISVKSGTVIFDIKKKSGEYLDIYEANAVMAMFPVMGDECLDLDDLTDNELGLFRVRDTDTHSFAVYNECDECYEPIPLVVTLAD